MAEFLSTHDIFAKLTAMLRCAKHYITIVSPYIILDGEQSMLLKKAAENGVQITIVYRLDSTETAERLKKISDYPGIKIIGCPELHAKIYITENAAIMTSKNLTSRKYTCSIEIGLLFDWWEGFYRKLVEASREFSSIPDSNVLVDNSEYKGRHIKGYCIRCGRQIVDLDKNAPLCEDCYDTWKMFRNREYGENYCHYCGNEAECITFNNPIEDNCIEKYKNARRILFGVRR